MARPDFDIDPAWLQRIIDASRELGATHPERVTVDGDRSGAIFACTAIRRSIDGGNIYLHEWRGSDTRDPHCHPWDCASIILSGGYWEITAKGRCWRAAGDIVFRRAEEPHRVELDPAKPVPVSLFLTGARYRTHGFHTADGWISARRYARERAGAPA